MKPLSAVLLLLSVSAHAADSPERAIVATMKLSEQPNYSWSCVVTDDAGTYDIAGKVERGGYTLLRQPLVKAMARRLGRRSDPQMEVVFNHRGDCVIKTDDGWRTLKELPKRHEDWYGDGQNWPTPAMAMGAWSLVDPGDPFYKLPVLLPPPEEKEGPYSNAQFGLSYPHEELGVIVTSCVDFTVDGAVASGRLTDIGAKLLLVRDNQKQIEPIAAAGAFKLLIEGGIVVKYIVRLEGVLKVDRRKVYVRQTSTTVLSDVGTTKVDAPPEAVRRLEPLTAFAGVIGR